ncbi:MAG: hypothetical protein LQ339_005534 [Xanthoria mediterranea]|nr:MAG: hypothetical protein LQ339_005534 [Xanthoria mediterranea]
MWGILLLVSFVASCLALRYDPAQVAFNLNENTTATDPAQYWGEWRDHKYNPSPTNWRFPFYTLFLDRFVNGDPSNDDANGTSFEHDPMANQLRHGGDVAGLADSLDYLQGMGIKGIYIAGSALINLPWAFDGYSPVDFTLLDYHFGTIAAWRAAITAIHDRGMYVVMDNTMATMSNLIGFEGYMNASTPFRTTEHKVQWKTDRQYMDFHFGNTYNQSCAYPRLWLETGFPVGPDVTSQLKGCYDSDFDQYGDIEAFGVFPDWQRQLAKFASVQDRLREWVPSVRERIQRHSCIMIAQLDIDGFRFDKATQVTVDAQGAFGNYMRECARKLGKDNFFMPGEITGGNTFGSIYLGRGRQPDMVPETMDEGYQLTNDSDDKYFIRDPGYNALDAAAFHYSIYRSLTRFLGMDGSLSAGFDSPSGWVDAWNDMVRTNDLVNPNPGGPQGFDPRHMYGVTNQDVFRWPAIKNGTAKQLLGLFITTLHMPGIPKLLWGEEQAFYILDNTAGNYVFGRQAMSSATAWQTHGCYSLKTTTYFNFPVDSATHGCHDDSVSLDHRDPSNPIRNIIKAMYQMRENFPVLNDGWTLQSLSNQTEYIQLPGSGDVPTEIGMWSTLRALYAKAQDFTGQKQGNQSVWLVYSNRNESRNYQFDCSNNATGLNVTALIAPFDEGTTVKNLFYPYDEVTLIASVKQLGIEGSTKYNGCLKSLTLDAWEFKAYVPKDQFVGPKPMVTKFVPGHDARIASKVAPGKRETVPVELHYSERMDCDMITNTLKINSTTEDRSVPTIDKNSVNCQAAPNSTAPPYVGGIPTQWTWAANLVNVANGVHQLTLSNVTSRDNGSSTDSVDHFLFRIGQPDNPMVFPRSANISKTLLNKGPDGDLFLSHKAAGADLFRYSSNWGSSYSDWMPYPGGNTTLEKQAWSGTKNQEWPGEHVIVQYWNRMTGSSDHIQRGDLGRQDLPARRFPHLFWQGPYNQYGFDAGIDNEIRLHDDGLWKFHFMTEWPAIAQVNVWGINPDGQPDQTGVYGDVDGDSVLDRLPPSSLSSVVLNITIDPPSPYLAWEFSLDDGTYRFNFLPVGSRWRQMALYFLLWLVPVVTGAAGIWAFMKSFYQVKFNQTGISDKKALIPLAVRRKFKRMNMAETGHGHGALAKLGNRSLMQTETALVSSTGGARRTVLIATMEYDIEDWGIKIKIGGLGVMAQLMGKNLGHQNLIWVVPCVGGVDYPVDQKAEDMHVTILGNRYDIKVQYHVLRNITYVLLDAPVFRRQSKTEPYPPRMDDLESAIYYSAFNQCIALAIKRFPVDMYHINDYHGCVAPLHLLPDTVPVCLSLHNAEFQGLWPMRTAKEVEEVCKVYNLPVEVVAKYVQFGEVFNLLHSGASYLRLHQQGFGAVGVSNKYGVRSHARYPIFWGLKKIGKLPNPDPSDTGEWDKKLPKEEDIHVDAEFEAGRAELRSQAQTWAKLDQNPKADLFVFVGRWSTQKGIDLIADIFPSVLEEYPDVQLICIGPVIDLYGKFAALKLDRMMKLYPGRVYSKPEFTALPPYIFSGAEFALIPSRDEPFGLVAVEFGRKGALGVGARVGGLGQMPGWWYTVESTTTTHLLHQFKMAIEGALASKQETRAMMRARSAKQRFPVAQWVEDLEILQSTAIKIHQKEAGRSHPRPPTPALPESNTPGLDSPILPGTPLRADSRSNSGTNLAGHFASHSRASSYGNLISLNNWTKSRPGSTASSRAGSPTRAGDTPPVPKVGRTLSLGMKAGPGHLATGERRGRKTRGHARDRSSAHSNWISNIHEEEGEYIIPSYYADEEYTLSEDKAKELHQRHRLSQRYPLPALEPLNQDFLTPSNITRFGATRDLTPTVRSPDPASSPPTPLSPGPNETATDALLAPHVTFSPLFRRSASGVSMLSVDSVVGDKKDFQLQKVDPFFTDSNGEYYKAFDDKLKDLDAKTSEGSLCIEDYLVKSERKWFNKFRDARLGRTPGQSRHASPAPSIFKKSRPPSPIPSISDGEPAVDKSEASDGREVSDDDEYLLGNDYKPPTGLRKYMQVRIGDWPLYSFFLAFGQIIAANSYQITLLTGTVGQTAEKLYVIASIYLVTSIMWWFCFRYLKSIYVLSIPFFFYGMAFLLVGLAHFAPTIGSRGWVQNIATAMYAIASSSGSIFFALNFGDEGGAPIKAWVYRACVIQGTQQAYVVGLWYWGSTLTKATASGITATNPVVNSSTMTAITAPIAILLWAIGLTLFLGLPDYYRQAPGTVPSFYTSLIRRKIILWFFVTVIIQNYFLSAPYGRNWGYLWSSHHAQPYQILLLIVLFFGFVWAGFLYVFGVLSKDHSWILPVFAIGLGAPRWCQMLWGTSGIGLSVPWAGGRMAGALVGRSLWLWLGVLDAVQGVGFGMILLQTLTRIHIAFTLIAAQVLGSIATILARATAPNKIGPGDIFPDFSAGYAEGLGKAWFWVALIFQLLICVGFFAFFRKEQLSKP